MYSKKFIAKLNEGFNLYRSNGVYYVEMTDEHEDGVDTSLSNNPLSSTLDVKIKGLNKIVTVPVVSIFRYTIL